MNHQLFRGEADGRPKSGPSRARPFIGRWSARMLAGFGLLALGVVVIMGLVLWRYHAIRIRNEEQVVQRASERANALASTLADTLGATILRVDAMHGLARLLTEARLAGDATSETELRGYLAPDTSYGGPDVTQIGAILPSGWLLWSNRNWMPNRVDFREREHFRVFIDHPETGAFLERPVLGLVSGHRSVQYSRALRAADGTLRAVTVVSLDARLLSRLCHDMDLAPDDMVTFVRDDGTVLMRRDMTGLGEKVQPRPPPAEHGQLTAQRSAVDGVMRYSVSKKIPGVPGAIRVGISQASQVRALALTQETLWHGTLLLEALVVAVAAAAGTILVLVHRSGIESVRSDTLAESEAWFRSIFEEAQDGVMVSELSPADGMRISYVNRFAAELIGIPRSQIIGRDPIEFVHAEDRELIESRRAAIASKESRSHSVYRVKRSDGTYIWIGTNTVIVPDLGDPGHARTLTLFWDISEQHGRDAALAEARDQLDRMLEVIPGVFYQVELRDGKVSRVPFVSPSVEAVFGVSAAEAAVPGFLSGKAQIDVNIVRREALRKAGPHGIGVAEYPVQLRGRTVWVRDTIRSQTIEDGTEQIVGFLTDITAEHAVADARAVAERELAEARASLDRMLEVMPSIFYRVVFAPDESYRVTFVSPSVKAVFGVSVEEASKPGFLEARTLGDLHATRRQAMREAGPGGVATAAYGIRLSDRELWVRDTFRRVRLPDNGSDVVGFLADITSEHLATQARAAAEQELKRSNRALEAYSRSLSALIRSETLKELLTRVCESIITHPGYILACVGVPVETDGLPIDFLAAVGPAAGYLEQIDISWSADRPTGRGPAGVAVREGRSTILEDTHADPRFAPWLERAAPYGIRSSITVPCRSGGRVVGLMIVYASHPRAFRADEQALFEQLADETGFAIALEENRARLRSAEENLRASAELGPGLLYRATAGIDTIAVTSVFGNAAGIVRGIVADAEPAEALTTLLCTSGQLSEVHTLPDDGHRSSDFPIEAPDGGTRWMRNALRLTGRSGETVDVIGYLTEITREKQQQLRNQQITTLLTLGEMATGMAHELNQPLASISFAAQNASWLLGRQPQDATAIGGKLEKIVNEAHRASRLIEHMRIFGRNEHAPRIPVAWRDVLASALEIMRSQTTDCQIVETLAPDLPPVMGEPIPMEQVLINLISNAIDAYRQAPAGTHAVVRIEGFVRDSNVVVRVSDYAGGFAPEVLSRAFEPFFTTKPPGKGTGLGLAIVFGTIAEMGGRVSAANEDGGAVVELTLPAAPNR